MNTERPIAANLLIAPVAVDFYDSSGELFKPSSQHIGITEQRGTPETEPAIDSMRRIIELKRKRPHSASAIDINRPDELTPLRTDRKHAVALRENLVEAASRAGLSVATYGFSDVACYPAELPAGIVHRGLYRNTTLYVRTEEHLALAAENIAIRIESILDRHRSIENSLLVEGTQFWLEGDTLNRTTRQGDTSATPLHGYEFNRSGSDATHEREHFSNFPSCELFIAATAIEQSALGDEVVRIVPNGMRNREVAARAVLRLLDVHDPKIISCVLSSSGRVQKKIISWGTNIRSSTAYRLCTGFRTSDR